MCYYYDYYYYCYHYRSIWKESQNDRKGKYLLLKPKIYNNNNRNILIGECETNIKNKTTIAKNSIIEIYCCDLTFQFIPNGLTLEKG